MKEVKCRYMKQNKTTIFCFCRNPHLEPFQVFHSNTFIYCVISMSTEENIHNTDMRADKQWCSFGLFWLKDTSTCRLQQLSMEQTSDRSPSRDTAAICSTNIEQSDSEVPGSVLSSRWLLSVSIKASVRSYWLISAVSAGGKGSTAAGLSDS